MPRKRVLKDSDRKELETLLLNPHFGAVYRGLRKKSEYAEVEALKFLRLYIAQIEFVESHSDEPLVVRDHLNELNLDDFQRNLVADGLARWFIKPAGGDLQFTHPGVLEYYRDVFGAYPSHCGVAGPREIENGPISGKANEQQKSEGEGMSDESGRDDLDKIGNAMIGKPKLTADQFILLIFAIGGSRLKGLDRKRVAEGLSALTGDSVNHFCNRFSQVLPSDEGIAKFNDRPSVYNQDVEKVCKILRKMGLTDEVEKLQQMSNS